MPKGKQQALKTHMLSQSTQACNKLEKKKKKKKKKKKGKKKRLVFNTPAAYSWICLQICPDSFPLRQDIVGFPSLTLYKQ